MAMNLEQIVAVLIQERDRLDAAIEALQGPAARKPRAVAETTHKTAKKKRLDGGSEKTAARENARVLGQEKENLEGLLTLPHLSSEIDQLRSP